MAHKLHPMIVGIRKDLRQIANPDYARRMQAYMKSEMLYHGIKSAEQTKVKQKWFKEFPVASFNEYIELIQDLWAADFREERYVAISLGNKYKKFQTMEALPVYQMMIQDGAWWDYVDAIAANLIGALLKKYPAEMRTVLYQWIEHDDLWLRRSAILAQLKFKANTDETMLFEFCARCMEEKVFWIRKAIGWALREYSKTNPDSVREFVEKTHERMSGVTWREARKYI